MDWTPNQSKAIKDFGHNIIVSAGAGSGKTAVLSERVLHHVENNISVDELLILTFTNAAAAEMKERIRKKLIKNNHLNEANKVDTAYITTFDSLALSILKKYSYTLNLSSNISITFLACSPYLSKYVDFLALLALSLLVNGFLSNTTWQSKSKSSILIVSLCSFK